MSNLQSTLGQRRENMPFHSSNVLYLAGCYAEAGRKADALAMLDKARDSFGTCPVSPSG